MGKDDKPIIAAILNIIIPGLGNYFIKSKYALHYFAVWIVLWIAASIVVFVSFFICAPAYILPGIWNLVAAYDVYFEAMGQPEKRLLKEYIK
ncbi:MAG: hypothetical protein ABIH83_02690 [Candidatus Micrarchaeota archaeon]